MSHTYTVDVRFKTTTDRTPRVIEIGEHFGLGLGDKDFVVFDNAKIDITPGDVVYITGESGAGKSILLRELSRQMSEKGMQVADIDKVVLEDKSVVDLGGKTTNAWLQTLGVAGLNDANMWLRKPKELSDGQRYRLRLALLIDSGADVWTADEFLAVLDRTTAKNVAFNMQKIARAAGATLLVATTHSDMVADLHPNLKITKRYREKVEFVRAPEGFRDDASNA